MWGTGSTSLPRGGTAGNEAPVHYFSDTPDGAWAEFLCHEEITDPEDLPGIRRALWQRRRPRGQAFRLRLRLRSMLGIMGRYLSAGENGLQSRLQSTFLAVSLRMGSRRVVCQVKMIEGPFV